MDLLLDTTLHRILEPISIQLYHALSLGVMKTTHYCSLRRPCHSAISALSPLLTLRLVSRACNAVFLRLAESNAYFQSVEDAYYPHSWHINTKIRRGIILERYRVFRTLYSEGGKRYAYRNPG
jgi:hypothetical protein